MNPESQTKNFRGFVMYKKGKKHGYAERFREDKDRIPFPLAKTATRKGKQKVIDALDNATME